MQKEAYTTSFGIIKKELYCWRERLTLHDYLIKNPNFINELIECWLSFKCDKLALAADYILGYKSAMLSNVVADIMKKENLKSLRHMSSYKIKQCKIFDPGRGISLCIGQTYSYNE